MARWQVTLAALFFSTGGAAIKLCGVSGLQIAALRSLIGAVFLASVLPAARRGWTGRTLLVSMAYAATMMLFILANVATTAASAVFLQSTAPIYVLVFGRWWLKEGFDGMAMVRLAGLLVGMLVLLGGAGPAQETAPDPARGNLYGVLAGVVWGLTLVGLRWVGREGDAEAPMRAVVCGNALAAALAFSLWPAGEAMASGAVAWGALIWLGVVQVGLAYVFLTRAVTQLPGFEASFLLMLEPVLAPLWAFAVHAERVSPLSALGALLILVSSLLPALRELARRRSRP